MAVILGGAIYSRYGTMERYMCVLSSVHVVVRSQCVVVVYRRQSVWSLDSNCYFAIADKIFENIRVWFFTELLQCVYVTINDFVNNIAGEIKTRFAVKTISRSGESLTVKYFYFVI